MKYASDWHAIELAVEGTPAGAGRTGPTRRDADAAWLEAERLITTLSLDPSRLWRPIRRLSQQGQIKDAQHLLALMQKTAGRATADSSVARNYDSD